MSDSGIVILAVISSLAVMGFLIGLARGRHPFAPFIAACVVVAGFFILLAVTGGWVAACPGCTSHVSNDSARWADLFSAIIWGGLFMIGILLFIWLGSSVSAAVQWLRRRRA